LPDYRQQNGQICENILCEHLLREGFWILRPLAAQGPVDVVAITEDGEVYFFDAKQDAIRTNPGRKIASRIHRARSPLQKQLGVRVAYVDIDTRAVHIVPAL
jgi:hypothetical protein